MKKIIELIKIDLKRLYIYRILHFVVVLTFLFSMAMAIFPNLDASNFLYIYIFIMPVIVFSIAMFIERDEEEPAHSVVCEKPLLMITAKVLSSLIIQLIPLFFFILVFIFRVHSNFSVILLILTYLLGCTVHILIGLTLSIISKTTNILSLSYVTYIIIFSVAPIFYSNGFIPLKYEYYLIISPAFLSGVLVDNILSGMVFSDTWLLVLSVVMQLVYCIVLTLFVIRPFFKQYLISIGKTECK